MTELIRSQQHPKIQEEFLTRTPTINLCEPLQSQASKPEENQVSTQTFTNKIGSSRSRLIFKLVNLTQDTSFKLLKAGYTLLLLLSEAALPPPPVCVTLMGTGGGN